MANLSRINTLEQDKHRRRKKDVITGGVGNVATKAIGTASLVLATQALYVGLTTPRLKPPLNSGSNFEPNGLVIKFTDGVRIDSNNNDSHLQSEEIRVILIGDSPVEGIGNETHRQAMGGQTAFALMNLFKKSVRYWSLGKSGLTAGGIQNEMVPLMRNISSRFKIDLVVVSCGVNNVLSGHSASAFGCELDSLLDSINSCRFGSNVPIILLGLLDFSHMPFLPFPLCSVAGWRSRTLQKEMEKTVERRSLERTITIAQMPDVDTILNNTKHPLLKNADIEDGEKLEIDDFFADDGFHPAKYGTIMLGNLLSQTYKEIKDNC
mmetsp:Transcript_25394/g.32022  ORF Transcript_25394/g.32022 Transcript_25394/m.32022 type:complete len:322 (-) Transcript_25394:34-999(-)